jgi:hypothetical protein
MYGKELQVNGYLIESQRHDKAGYSLTKLLCWLNEIEVTKRYATPLVDSVHHDINVFVVHIKSLEYQ